MLIRSPDQHFQCSRSVCHEGVQMIRTWGDQAYFDTCDLQPILFHLTQDLF